MLDKTTKWMPEPSPWTEEKIDRLKRYWSDEGLTAGQITFKFEGEFSRSAILGKAHRLGLDKRRDAMYKLTPAQKIEREQANVRKKIARQRERRVETRERLPDKTLPPLVVKETPKPAEFLGIAFTDLERDMCRYPRGEGAAVRFCGQPATYKSYCTHCTGIAYQRGPSHSLRHIQIRETHQLVVPNGPEGELSSP